MSKNLIALRLQLSRKLTVTSALTEIVPGQKVGFSFADKFAL
jgi:hypothetical protein